MTTHIFKNHCLQPNKCLNYRSLGRKRSPFHVIPLQAAFFESIKRTDEGQAPPDQIRIPWFEWIYGTNFQTEVGGGYEHLLANCFDRNLLRWRIIHLNTGKCLHVDRVRESTYFRYADFTRLFPNVEYFKLLSLIICPRLIAEVFGLPPFFRRIQPLGWPPGVDFFVKTCLSNK